MFRPILAPQCMESADNGKLKLSAKEGSSGRAVCGGWV